MRHALGVQPYRFGHGLRYTKPYRNRFVAGEHHVAVWDGLVEKGHATKREGNQVTGDCPVYRVTEAGRTAALAGITFKRRWGYEKKP